MSEIQSNLVSGSYWTRTTKGKTKTSLVLAVTNTDLSPELQEKNPSQVVYMTETGSTLSMGVEQFLARRTYTGINQLVADMLSDIKDLGFEEEDTEEDSVDIGAIAVDESQFPSQDQLTEGSEDEGGEEEAHELVLNIGPHPHKEILEANFIGYRESPFHTGDTLHTLSFMLDEECTLAVIHSAFNLQDPNAVQKFEVTAPFSGAFQIEHEGVAGVFLEANGSFAVGNLNLTTSGDFRADINAVLEQQAATNPSVVTDVEVKAAPQAPQAAPQVAPAAPVQQPVVVVS